MFKPFQLIRLKMEFSLGDNVYEVVKGDDAVVFVVIIISSSIITMT